MMIAVYVAGSAIEAGWAAGRRPEWLREVRSNSAAFLVAAVAGLRAAGLEQDRIFESWDWGGYIMYSWPSARLAVDPLKFNDSTTHMYSIIDAVQPGWQDEIARWDIRTAIIHPDSRLARGLERDPGWDKWYSDSIAVVFRPASD